MKTAYLEIHERESQRLLKDGKTGWSSKEDIQSKLDFLQPALKQMRPIKSKILVLGCGDGELSLHLAKQGFIVTGVDISPTAIAWAQQKAEREQIEVRFQSASVLKLPFENESYDLVVDDHCFHCIIGTDRSIFLDEARRVLSPEGILFIRTMCGDMPDSTPAEVKAMFDAKTRCQVFNGIAGRYFGLEKDILQEIEAAGFRISASRIQNQPDGPDLLNVTAYIQ